MWYNICAIERKENMAVTEPADKGPVFIVPSTVGPVEINEFEAPIPGTEEDTPPFVCPNPDRLARLERIYLDIAGCRDETAPLSDETRRYLWDSGNPRLLLWELGLLTAPRTLDLQRGKTREQFLQTVLEKPAKPWQHAARKEKIQTARDQYVETVLDYITEVLDADTPDQMLAVRELPSFCERISFSDTWPATLDDLAANHLSLLTDTMLKEHIPRREIIDNHNRRSRLARVASNRAVRAAIGAGIFGLAVLPHTGMIPIDHEYFTEDLETILKGVSVAILCVEMPELARYTFWGAVNRRATKKLTCQLAGDEDLSDRALRIMYGSTRYGSEDGQGFVTGRGGVSDRTENERSFKKLENEFAHLNNDPGGKPYTPDQALGYVGRLIIERADQLQPLIDTSKPAEERRALYIKLCRSVLEEDLARMVRGLTETRARRFVVNTGSLLAGLVFSSGASVISEASTLARDTRGAILKEAEIEEADLKRST